MALLSRRSLFLHVPKTGGWFVRYAFRDCGIKHCELGHEHSCFPDLSNFKSDDFFKSVSTFLFIRHPLTWYQSMWSFRVSLGWSLTHPLDFNCAANDFSRFVEKVKKKYPYGWFTTLIDQYSNNIPGGLSYIGKQETIVESTIKAFELSGECFDPEVIRKLPRVNETRLGDKTSSQVAVHTLETRQMIEEMEKSIISRFYA